MQPTVSLGMYDLAETRDATDALYRAIARALNREGIAGVPDALDRDRPLEEAWRSPDLLFAQICGYPMLHAFAGAVRAIATPCHAIEGCELGEYRSIVVVRERARIEHLEDLRGTIAAINDHASHSGKNALYALVAPLAPLAEDTQCPSFFADVRETGSHVASLGAVARGQADVAAIDCITHSLLLRHRPSALEGTRAAFVTASAPAPPYVTRKGAADDLVARLRAALTRAFDDPDAQGARQALLLCGVRMLDDAAYESILAMEELHRGRRVAPAVLAESETS